MTKKRYNMNEFWNLFMRGRVYLIRRVEKDWVTVSRLRRFRNGLKVSEFMFTRKLGYPETGILAKPDDLIFKAYERKWKLLRAVPK